MMENATNCEVRVLPDGAAIARRAAQKFVEAGAAAVNEKGSFSVVLAGGSTPKTLYGLLVNDPALRAQGPWDKMQVFFSDQRPLGPHQPDRKFRTANEGMIF